MKRMALILWDEEYPLNPPPGCHMAQISIVDELAAAELETAIHYSAGQLAYALMKLMRRPRLVT